MEEDPNITPEQGLLVGGNFQTITMGTGPANIEVTINPLNYSLLYHT